MAAINSVPIVYKQGSYVLSPIFASVHSHDADEIKDQVVVVRTDLMFFTVDVPKMRVGDVNIIPQNGDQIEWDGRIYQVVPVEEGQPPYLFSTANRLRIIISAVEQRPQYLT